jgi:hypothetical protein
MSTYVFVYRAPRGFTPGDPDASAAWVAWFRGISDHVVEPGKPVFTRREVGEVPGDTELGGYSLISAADIDEAVRLADGCPVISNGGSIEIGELAELSPELLAGIGSAATSAA